MNNLSTKYAPANRIERELINEQNKYVENNPTIIAILNALAIVAVILNEHRQIIYANKILIEMLGLSNPEDVLSLRPGEALNCVNSKIEPGGCGTSENCRYCGAVNSILESQITGEKVTKECRITSESNGEKSYFDFSVTSTPLDVEGNKYTVLSVTDIGEQKRKRALERIFFHDVINTAGGLNGFIDYMRDIDDQEELRQTLDDISQLSARLLDEIISQRDLSSAENNELAVIPNEINSVKLIGSIVNNMLHHNVSEGKTIVVDNNIPDLMLKSDKRLLERVITNMLKNGIEATNKGGSVKIGAYISENKIVFYVNNSTVMPREVELQIFQRSFSTKGANRGLGTYSMKLIGERYLEGKVGFTTNSIEGTTFFIELPI
jgi:K+-sensing histidine kinase KdpD